MEEHPVLLKNALRAAAKEAFEDPTAMKEHLEEIPDPFAPNVETLTDDETQEIAELAQTFYPALAAISGGPGYETAHRAVYKAALAYGFPSTAAHTLASDVAHRMEVPR